MTPRVGVIGTGSFGTVITGLLVDNGADVLVWGRRADVLDELASAGSNEAYLPGYHMKARPHVTTSLEELGRSTDILFSVVPAKATRRVMAELGDHLHPRQIVVSCSKGLEPETLERMTTVITEETPVRKVGALSGPNLAKEIAASVPSSTAIASAFDEVIEEVHGVLNSTYFRVFGSHDPIGVELCGSLKNIYAIGSGVAHGLGYGLNARSFLLTQALREMRFFSMSFGAHEETFSGIAGVGDLITTAMSELSRNFRFGTFIAEGQTSDEALASVGQTVEGLHTAQAVYDFARQHGLRLPITEAVYKVVHGAVPLDQAIERLLTISTLMEEDLYV